MSIIWCEIKSVECRCKNGNCPFSATAVIDESTNEPVKVKERKINKDPGNIKPRTKK